MCSTSESGVCCGRHGPCCCSGKLKDDQRKKTPSAIADSSLPIPINDRSGTGDRHEH